MTHEEHNKRLEELYEIAIEQKDVPVALQVLEQIALRTLILGD